MAHTRPPWSSKWRMATIFEQIDSGELAARLGSIDTFDRRGDVVWMDNFEDIIDKWTPALLGTGAEVALSITRVLSGGSSAMLVTGNAVDDYVEIRRVLAYPVLGPMGFEAALALDGACKDIFFDMILYDGTTVYTAQVDIEPIAGNLKVEVPTAAYTIFDPSFTFRQTSAMFHIVKLVADFNTGKYVRFIFDDTTYDLSSYTIDHAGSGIGASLEIRIKIVTNVAVSRTNYVDNVIVTQNEP